MNYAFLVKIFFGRNSLADTQCCHNIGNCVAEKENGLLVRVELQ